jgi:hypothetical protein
MSWDPLRIELGNRELHEHGLGVAWTSLHDNWSVDDLIEFFIPETQKVFDVPAH